MRGRIYSTILLLLVGCLSGSAISAESLYLVAHPDVPVNKVTRDELRSIYFGHTTRWSDGTALIPAMRKDSDDQSQFISSVLKKTGKQFKSFWRQAIFTGEGIPPRSFESNEAMLSFISATPGALGFATRLPDSVHVKVIELKSE